MARTFPPVGPPTGGRSAANTQRLLEKSVAVVTVTNTTARTNLVASSTFQAGDGATVFTFSAAGTLTNRGSTSRTATFTLRALQNASTFVLYTTPAITLEESTNPRSWLINGTISATTSTTISKVVSQLDISPPAAVGTMGFSTAPRITGLIERNSTLDGSTDLALRLTVQFSAASTTLTATRQLYSIRS